MAVPEKGPVGGGSSACGPVKGRRGWKGHARLLTLVISGGNGGGFLDCLHSGLQCFTLSVSAYFKI